MSPIISPRRPRERSRQPALDVLGGHAEPNAPQTGRVGSGRVGSQKTPEPRRPVLRIVGDERDEAGRDEAPVLLAGADAGRRAVLLTELRLTLPPRTRFSQADDVSEVLKRARSSSMVVLAGDLDDADAGSLMRLLGRRHPRLPVISVDAAIPAAAGARS